MTYLVVSSLVRRIGNLRRTLARQQDDGYSTETIAVVALLVVLALAVIGVLASKVIAKANSIDLDGSTG